MSNKTTGKRIFGLPKNVFFLGLTSFFNDFSSEMVLSIFPAFFASVLKTGAASLGLVEGIADAASNFLKVFSGRLSDKLQKRRLFVIAGYTLSVLTRPFYLFAASVGAVLSLRVLDRVGKGLRDAPRDAIISLSVEKNELGRSFGYHRMMDSLGGILGPLVAFVILYYVPFHFDIVFITAFFVGILALMTLVFISDIVVPGMKSSDRPLFSLDGLPLSFKFFLLAVFLLSLGSIPIAVLLLTTEHIGLMIATIPLFYMLHNLAHSVFSVAAGEASDRNGGIAVLIFGYGALLVSYLLFSFASSALTLAIAFLVLGFYSALTDGVQRAIAGRLTGVEVRGTAHGLLNAAVGIGALCAGIIGGYLWQFYGPAVAFGVAAVSVLAGLSLLFWCRNGKCL